MARAGIADVLASGGRPKLAYGPFEPVRNTVRRDDESAYADRIAADVAGGGSE